jgi:hypothetical protein
MIKKALSKVQVLLFLITIFFFSSTLSSEGFPTGTLVKTSGGYTVIEQLYQGNKVISCTPQGTFSESTVVEVHKKKLQRYSNFMSV